MLYMDDLLNACWDLTCVRPCCAYFICADDVDAAQEKEDVKYT